MKKSWFGLDDNKLLYLSAPRWSFKLESGIPFVAVDGLEQARPVWERVRPQEYLPLLRDAWTEYVKDDASAVMMGFIGYDYAGMLEPAVTDPRPGALGDFPTMFFTVYTKSQRGSSARLMKPVKKTLPKACVKSLVTDAEYERMIEAVLNYIEAGEVYEVNISRPLFIDAENIIDSYLLSKLLYAANPAPHSAYFPIDEGRAICSASPECFLKKFGQVVSTYPIKGTTPRFVDEQRNTQEVRNLVYSEKELSEHLMVVDLERNDLGRLALPGTVRVGSFAQAYTFTYVNHLVSKVSCSLRRGLDFFDVLQHAFPSGSISGAPKIRAMQIIAELEPYGRSAYTGTLGYIDGAGDGLFNILIRTLLVDKFSALLNVGGGIVRDSMVQSEIAETYLKARGFCDLFHTALTNQRSSTIDL